MGAGLRVGSPLLFDVPPFMVDGPAPDPGPFVVLESVFEAFFGDGTLGADSASVDRGFAPFGKEDSRVESRAGCFEPPDLLKVVHLVLG